MPTYEYVCDACRHQFEQFQSIKADSLKKCPECGREFIRKTRYSVWDRKKNLGATSYVHDEEIKSKAILQFNRRTSNGCYCCI